MSIAAIVLLFSYQQTIGLWIVHWKKINTKERRINFIYKYRHIFLIGYSNGRNQCPLIVQYIQHIENIFDLIFICTHYYLRLFIFLTNGFRPANRRSSSESKWNSIRSDVHVWTWDLKKNGYSFTKNDQIGRISIKFRFLWNRLQNQQRLILNRSKTIDWFTKKMVKYWRFSCSARKRSWMSVLS